MKRIHSTQASRSTRPGTKPASVKEATVTNKETPKGQFTIKQTCGCGNNTLDLHGKGIKKIEKFEILKGTNILDLSCNSIEEIENLDNKCEITELKLYGNNLRQINNLDRLRELRVLQLQYNHITSLRKGLLKLRKLQTLRLDSNQLVCVESREFAGLSQLTSLDISHNQLTDITAVNALPCLEELFASHNKLCGIVDLSRCNKLQEIDLSNNKISEVQGLSFLETLTSLDLSNNVLSSTKSLGVLSSLQVLNLANNQLKSVCSFSKQFLNLEILNIANNCIDMKKELKFLAQCCHLEELQIAGNNTGTSEEENEHLMQISFLMPHLKSLDKVILNDSSNKKLKTLVIPKTALANASLESMQEITSSLMDLESEMENLQKSFVGRFSEMKNLIDSLPKQLPWRSSYTTSASLTPVANYGSRSQTRCNRLLSAKIACMGMGSTCSSMFFIEHHMMGCTNISQLTSVLQNNNL
ncbi:protein phosphatase 1 regulatory subunit 7-like isoform X1 [Hypanus sabinus]|uniref:protein phosphatase 1 regulatory subunit 7-like isoform X1 n=1 Tax=Hypanus sabinus TaxID=79690 RepID=UPI0028C45059|nr:protein phosphatase 1 regulatory subunit 7-like isoform X1 [Hypanus sabinus]XP_059804830.1 protein phosphatase 1 regulatory subunit 7-like isoform X1 [Hypanus sabinus]XP_059804831.1 protein phosphatase 1 regulatory subunit 7-like isoform X1 [Hypanus sabinus]XP_059804832.1 protein phosphatase 1 regulatory subunit 7-like isoform X1 [Hypanus sabinus]